MEFIPYPKMPRRPDLPPPGGAWVATEKIHGANFVVGIGADGAIRFGKRRAWLDPGEPFFGWQLLAGTLSERARALAMLIRPPELGPARLYLWGELFGGHYPGVASPPGLSAVQTGVWYAPDLRFAAFDLMIVEETEANKEAGEEADRTAQASAEGWFLPFSELAEAAGAVGLEVAPLIGRGTRQEVEAIPADGVTVLPARYGLPPIEGNRREGLVLRPDQAMRAGERIVFKKKIADFDELRFQEAESWSPAWLEAGDFQAWAARLVNPARVDGARSKVGVDPEAVAAEVALDVLVDLEAAFPQAFAALSREDLSRLEAEIRSASASLAQP